MPQPIEKVIQSVTFVFQCNGNGGKQLGANLVFMLAVIAWVGVFAVLIFGTLSVSGRAKLFTGFSIILSRYYNILRDIISAKTPAPGVVMMWPQHGRQII